MSLKTLLAAFTVAATTSGCAVIVGPGFIWIPELRVNAPQPISCDPPDQHIPYSHGCPVYPKR